MCRSDEGAGPVYRRFIVPSCHQVGRPTPFPPLPLGYFSNHVASLLSTIPHYSSHLSPHYHLVFFWVLLWFDHIFSSSSLQSYFNASYLSILPPHEWQIHLLAPQNTTLPCVPFCIFSSWCTWPWDDNLDLLSAWLTTKLTSQNVHLYELSDQITRCLPGQLKNLPCAHMVSKMIRHELLIYFRKKGSSTHPALPS